MGDPLGSDIHLALVSDVQHIALFPEHHLETKHDTARTSPKRSLINHAGKCGESSLSPADEGHS